MPLYTYENRETGAKIEVIRPVNERDQPLVLTFKRASRVPSRIGVVGVPRHAPTQGNRILAGYYHKEQTEGSRFKSTFTKKQIQEAWQ